MSLRVENLRCYRAGRLVVSGLSFQVAAGEAVMLRGPNGAGKSTVLRALAGMLQFDGTVELDGVSLAKDRDTVQEKIAYAGHLDAIKPQLTVEENLRFWANLFGGSGFDRAMQDFHLSELADRPAHTCSAGQKRRLGLARLAVSDRPLWLLDEPTVSLDVETTARFAEILRHHCAAGGMALVATHIDLGLDAPREIRMAPIQQADPDHHRHDAFLGEVWE